MPHICAQSLLLDSFEIYLYKKKKDSFENIEILRFYLGFGMDLNSQ
jgi:hypothetical protein